ncbi:MAG: AAA family ATPase [Syntrophaceticus schinkii]|nr:AAA family ATPase [Syntrophaceticus schinkii]
MEKVQVMLLGNHDNQLFALKKLLKQADVALSGVAMLGENSFEKILSIKPNVVLLQCAEDYDLAINTAARIYTEMVGCSVLLLCDRLEIPIIEKAMLAGVRRVLQLPLESKELQENIQLAFQLEKSRGLNNKPAVSMQSKVITVFGAKGGIGKTTIVVNLAVLLSQLGKKVAVIDADLQFGDVNVFLDIESKNTIAELSQSKDAADIDAIKQMTVLHHSGVSILCAPKSPEYAEYVTSKNIETIINTMRPFYDYILIDTTPLFNDTTLTAIENSNLVLLISGIDISTLRNTKTSLNILESLQQIDKMELVINKITNKIITIKAIERILDKPIKNQISYDFKTALASHNKGIPIVLDAPRTTIAKELAQLAGNVLKIINGEH